MPSASEPGLLAAPGADAAPPPVLYQYCGPDSLEPMLRGGRLWVSDSARMNDSTENVWIHEVVRRFFAAADRPSYGVDISDALYEFETHYALAKDPQVFITCFSARGDLLSQWRAYGKDGTGYSIGFRTAHWLVPVGITLDDISGFNGIGAALDRVVYHEAEQMAVLRRLLDRLSELMESEGAGASMYFRDAMRETGTEAMLYLARFMKHPDFFEEQEWRIACGNGLFGSTRGPAAGSLGFSEEIKYRPGDIAYRELDFRRGRTEQPLAEIILGPKCASTVEQVESSARLHGYQVATVRRSAVPYR